MTTIDPWRFIRWLAERDDTDGICRWIDQLDHQDWRAVLADDEHGYFANDLVMYLRQTSQMPDATERTIRAAHDDYSAAMRSITQDFETTIQPYVEARKAAEGPVLARYRLAVREALLASEATTET